MTLLSVNLNKVALLRNSRDTAIPSVIEAAKTCIDCGARGITVHPRPDARHITYADVRALKEVVQTEFNIEGYPSADFVQLVCDVRPAQVTLVPDPPDVLTSNAGWRVTGHAEMLQDVLAQFHGCGIRTSLFMETDPREIEAAAKVGAQRIELYTEAYARAHPAMGASAAAPFADAARRAEQAGLGVNAGHDLNLTNLSDFASAVNPLAEVSIGHALISDALYMGLAQAVAQYKACLAPQP